MIPQPCPNCGRASEATGDICPFCGQDLTGRGGHRRSWFWTGVTLLTLSGLFWLLELWPSDDGDFSRADAFYASAVITALPIGFGIYAIRRGRRGPTAVVVAQPGAAQPRVPDRDPASEATDEQRPAPGAAATAVPLDTAGSASWLGRWTKGVAGALFSVVVIVVLRLVIGAVFDGGDDAERIREQNEAVRASQTDTGGATAETDRVGNGRLSIFDIRGGDCFSLAGYVAEVGEAQMVGEVQLVPCSGVWQYILLNAFVVGADDGYPSQDYFLEQISRRCDPASTFQFYPEPNSWKLGDRTVKCTLEADAVFTPEVGRCFAPNVEEGLFADDRVSCDAPHSMEAFHVVRYEKSTSFPGQQVVDEFAGGACLSAFEPYVGTPYDESEVFFVFFRPTEATWRLLGDREIDCYLHLQDFEPIIGSLRGARR